jgi:release factor glutamine methyltransferase
MTFSEARNELKKMLTDIYDAREASHIAEWIIEDITGLSRMDRIMQTGEFTDEQEQQYLEYFDRLSKATPVQYVTGYAWFMGQRFLVNENVLIPRPETEELVNWVKESFGGAEDLTVLDIGTGSGCIPIMIKKLIPGAEVHALDISAVALDVARSNALAFGTDIHFHCVDILDETSWDKLPAAEVIISNPPYIPLRDKEGLHPNVVAHEPHTALFVPDDDALVFYRKILEFARKKRRGKVSVFFETHHALAGQVAALASRTAEIRKDMSGNERMVRVMLD